jgi:hypothetical protein
MKKTALSVALFTTAAGMPQAAAASEPFCYMESREGQMIDLTPLCGPVPVVTNASTRSVSSPEVIRRRATNNSGVPQTTPAAPVLTSTQRAALSVVSTGRWGQSAQRVAAMRPYWSGHCRIGNRPCHVFNKRSDFRAIQTTTGGGIQRTILGGSGSSGSGRCNYPSDRAADGSRCGGRSSQSRPGGK